MNRVRCWYVPRDVGNRIARNSRQLGLDPEPAQRTAIASDALREERHTTDLERLTTPRPGKGDRLVFDDENQWQVGLILVRGEGDPPVADPQANAAYDTLGVARAFYREVLGRYCPDDAGASLLGDANFGKDFGNAFWNGSRVVFGNGDGLTFRDFAQDHDVAGHELTHAVVEHTAALKYKGQSGALHEAFADIFGACVEQYSRQLDAGEFTWLIGEDVMGDILQGEALRSMAHPGTAFDNPIMGKDPQAASMAEYAADADPYVNAGIVSRAFYLTAMEFGTMAAAKLWYATLVNLWPDAEFSDAAYVCAENARLLSRDGGLPRNATQPVRAAFRTVGIR